ncbi:MAG: hypothetical protein SOW08_05780 [Lachnospiraceae bacterium]|nr:hypothetical protein [Lachnospiraceae bacterium]
MKNDILSKKRGILSVCLMVGVLIAAIGGTLAIYTSQDHQRSVVRNRDNEVIRFSSDKLYRAAGDTPAQKYYYPMGEDERKMTFQVCNYDQAKTTLFNEKQIDYRIEFEIKNGTEGFEYIISNGKTNKTAANGTRVSFNDSLTGGRKSSNSYSFTFDDGDFNNVELWVTVTPDNPTVTQNRILNGILIPIEYAATQGITLKWEFTDSTRGTPDNFDAYNLAFSISGGAGDALITWDASQLDIDPFFKEGKSVVEEETGWYSMTVPMNSDDATGSYLIQFFNHNAEKPEWADWSDIPITVSLKTQSGTEQNGTQ